MIVIISSTDFILFLNIIKINNSIVKYMLLNKFILETKCLNCVILDSTILTLNLFIRINLIGCIGFGILM